MIKETLIEGDVDFDVLFSTSSTPESRDMARKVIRLAQKLQSDADYGVKVFLGTFVAEANCFLGRAMVYDVDDCVASTYIPVRR